MCRALCWIIALPLFAQVRGFAQESAPVGIIRGDLLSWSGDAHGGELVFRNAENRVFQCSFDSLTLFESASQRMSPTAIRKGDRIEVVSDRREGTGICYARTVDVTEVTQVRAIPGQRPRSRVMPNAATESIVPRGDLTITGVVLKVSADELILRTRSNERKTISLRQDTRYLGGGQTLERANLEVGTRVFIRAGRNFEGVVEGYQIIWGDILEPVTAPRIQ